MATTKPPKVFISYKWGTLVHNQWVEQFAKDLRTARIDARLDKWEVRFGESFTDYMTSHIDEVDVVLFIITSDSVAAVEAKHGKGGAVKFEMQLATARRTAGLGRLIGIYREGNKPPTHLRDHRYADFRDDDRYNAQLSNLVDDLFGRSSKPPLGGGLPLIPEQQKIAELRTQYDQSALKVEPRNRTLAHSLRRKSRTISSSTAPKVNDAFLQPVQPDHALAKIVGSKPISRTELASKLWSYIKEHKLQDKERKTLIHADDALRQVFDGKRSLNMFEMNKCVNRHISRPT